MKKSLWVATGLVGGALCAAGVEVAYDLYEGGFHNFDAFARS